MLLGRIEQLQLCDVGGGRLQSSSRGLDSGSDNLGRDGSEHLLTGGKLQCVRWSAQISISATTSGQECIHSKRTLRARMDAQIFKTGPIEFKFVWTTCSSKIMSSRAASQKKGDNHLYFDVQERRVADSGTAMENSSYGVDVRDQSIQQGNGQIRRSKSRPTTSSSRPTNMKHNAYAYAYVSPFIQSAELRAQERARMGAAKRRKQQAEWNSEVAPRGNLFDPTIHKEDIFKLQPRRPKSASDQAGQEADGPVQHNQTNTRHRDDDMVRVGKIDSTMRPKMTMRSSGVRLAFHCTTSISICSVLPFHGALSPSSLSHC